MRKRTGGLARGDNEFVEVEPIDQTGETLIQWATSAGLFTSAADHTLSAAMPLDELLMMRQSKGFAKDRVMRGKYWWWRTGEYVWHESLTERDELVWIDFEGVVAKVWSQPMALLWPHGSGSTSHVPDFLTVSASGQRSLLDVRPAELIDEKFELDAELTRRACEAIGWGYCVATGHDLTALANITWLKGARHPRYRPDESLLDRMLDIAVGGCPRWELANRLNPKFPQLVVQHIDWACWHRLLTWDLTKRLETGTLLYANRIGASHGG